MNLLFFPSFVNVEDVFSAPSFLQLQMRAGPLGLCGTGLFSGEASHSARKSAGSTAWRTGMPRMMFQNGYFFDPGVAAASVVDECLRC